MRRLCLAGIIVLVVAVHGWIILGPFTLWQADPRLAQAHAPTHIEAIWLPPPAATPPVPQPASEQAPPPPVRQPAPAKRVQPVASPRVAAPEPAVPQTPEVQRPTPALETERAPAAPELVAEAPAIDSAPAPATPSAPALQVHSASGEAMAVQLPTDGSALQQQYQLRFQVEGVIKDMAYHAQAELSWRSDGTHYEARQSISAFLLGSLEQNSRGRITALGLQPEHFVDRRLGKRRSVTLDWEAGQATFEPARRPTPIGPGAQDRLSVFLQLAAMLHSQPALRTPGTRIDIPTLGSRRLQMWTFVVQAEEPLELPSGPLTTLRLSRLPQPGDDEQAQLWLSPEQGYAPVRIHLQEGQGDVLDLQWRP